MANLNMPRRNLQNEDPMTPVDKAINDVAFLFHKFYAQVLMIKELRLKDSDTSNTYCRILKPNTNIKPSYS